MQTPRYSQTRQKACQQCSSSKARCERKPGSTKCTRCTQRRLPCVFPQSNTPERSSDGLNMRTEINPPSLFSVSTLALPSPEPRLSGNTDSVANASDTRSHQPMSTPTSSTSFTATRETRTTGRYECERPEELDFSNLDLNCPINADDIQNRWIQAYIPIPGQTVKNYPTRISSFIYRILKSYTAASVNGRGTLPFIHPQQILAQEPGSPLTTCLSLIRICSNQLPGSSAATASILQREMHCAFDNRADYTSETLFAAFQAYLIYAMTLFFYLNQPQQDTSFRNVMTNLQELACASAQDGLVCRADQHRARPRWEEWIVAEAKRRTLFVMYLFDSIVSSQEGLPTFLGIELRGLPAPAGKLLWQASGRYEWEREYNIHLADWMEGGLAIDELWPAPPDLDEEGVVRRRARIDRWMENLDEYGTMLYAIMQCTHGD